SVHLPRLSDGVTVTHVALLPIGVASATKSCYRNSRDFGESYKDLKVLWRGGPSLRVRHLSCRAAALINSFIFLHCQFPRTAKRPPIQTDGTTHAMIARCRDMFSSGVR